MASKKRKWARRIVVVPAMIVLSAGAALFLLSPTGLRRMAPLVERPLSRVLGASVTLEGPVIRWPLELELARFRVADADTVYLDVRDAAVRVSARQLWRRHVWAHRVRVEQVAYDGWPTRDASERAPREPGPVPVPDPGVWFDWVTVEEAIIERVIVGKRVLPETAAFHVQADLTHGSAETTARMAVSMKALGETTWTDTSPVARAQATLTQPAPGHRRCVIEADIAHWGALIPDWPDELKDQLRVRGAIRFEDGRYIRLETTHVESPLADVDATAVLDAHAPHLRAQVNVMVPDASPLSQWLEMELEGGATLRATIEGEPSSPALDAAIESDRFRIGPRVATDIRVALNVENMAALTHGAVSAEATVDDVPAVVSAGYAWDSAMPALRDVQATALNVRVTGDVEVDVAARLARGLVRLETDDITELAAYGGVEAGGRVEAALHMTTDKKRQNVELELLAAGVTLPFGVMDALRIQAMLHDVLEEPHGTVEALVSHFEAGDLDVQEIRLTMAGDPEAVEWALTGAGALVEPWTLSSSGLVRLADGQPESLGLHDFNLRHGDFEVYLEEAARVARREDRYAVDRLVVHVGEGRLMVSGYAHSEDIVLEADVENMPLSTFGFAGVPRDAQGAMEGHLQVSGHPSNPRAALQLQFSDLLPTQAVFRDGPPAHFSVAAWLEDGRLSSRLLLEGLTGRPVELDVEIPLRVSLYPVHVQWPPEGPVSGQFVAETDLGELAHLFVLDVHRLAGMLSVNLELKGTVEKPDVSGHVRVTNGAYEHERTGTIFRDVAVLLTGQQNRLTIEQMTATDGDKGQLSLSGALQVQPELDYPFAAALSLDHFRLLRHDTARATGHGTVTWEGTRYAGEVAGQVTVSPVELRIPERLPAALIDLDVIEINGEEEEEDEAIELLEELERHAMTLHVDVSFPDRVFVRGRGLESEWGGLIHIRGSVREPQLTGSLSIVRGRFVFFGKRLAITRGLVTWVGVFPPTPILDVVAESRSGGITAILRLSGDVEAPEIRLDSVPPMPEDEILARLLFGREAARISPWQAITIAQAVRKLRGGGSAFDVMGETRRLLRVDQIELREDEAHEGQAAVSVGKYVSDRVYVELERGVGVEGGRALVEVELTPTIRLETEMGTDADAGLNVMWSWDY